MCNGSCDVITMASHYKEKIAAEDLDFASKAFLYGTSSTKRP